MRRNFKIRDELAKADRLRIVLELRREVPDEYPDGHENHPEYEALQGGIQLALLGPHHAKPGAVDSCRDRSENRAGRGGAKCAVTSRLETNSLKLID